MWSLAKKIWNRENTKPVCGLGVFHTGMGDRFQIACKIHDAAYIAQEEGIQTASRAVIDTIFLINMKLAFESSKGIRRVTGYLKAYLYYGLVRSLGWLAW